MTDYEANPKHKIRSSQPYGCSEDWSVEKWALNSPILDMHSLGVILLEIIAGTEVVLSCRDEQSLDELITECEDFIDKDTVKLLHQLIREHKDDLLKPYVEKVLLN